MEFRDAPNSTPASHSAPENHFPILVEGFDPSTQEIVWSCLVEQPGTCVSLPPLGKMFGRHIGIRVTFGNGLVQETV